MNLEKHICAAFKNDKRIDAVYLLGSAVNGRLRPDSDIDIAVLPAKGIKLDVSTRNRMVSSLSLELGREIDAGIISSENLVYSYQAIMTGKQLFSRNPLQVDNIVASLLGMYGEFNLERMEVSHAYSA